jgi:hypothetical protein
LSYSFVVVLVQLHHAFGHGIAGDFVCRQFAVYVSVTRGETTHRIKPATAAFSVPDAGASTARFHFRCGNSVYTRLGDFSFVRDAVNMLGTAQDEASILPKSSWRLVLATFG